MLIVAQPCSPEATLPHRTLYRAEQTCQIVHDSIHRRSGWTQSYLLEIDHRPAGFGSIAISGPWKDKPTIFEFYLRPEARAHAFDCFEAFLAASKARFFEVQSSDSLLLVMLHAYGRNVATESIVFFDGATTFHTCPGAQLLLQTSAENARACLEARQGGPEWTLECDGQSVAKGGILFHYNRPYGDIYMNVEEPFRRRGFGSYLVQELKREAYAMGAIPAARCNPTNIPSRRTLQKAGFVPYAHILNAEIGPG